MVQNCPHDSAVVRGDVLISAVCVLDASEARPASCFIGLSAESAISQCTEQALLLISEDLLASGLPPTQALCPPQIISSFLSQPREAGCGRAGGFDSLSRIVPAHLPQEVHIESAGEGNHKPQRSRPEPPLQLSVPSGVLAALELARALPVLCKLRSVLPQQSKLEGLGVVLIFGPFHKVLSLHVILSLLFLFVSFSPDLCV